MKKLKQEKKGNLAEIFITDFIKTIIENKASSYKEELIQIEKKPQKTDVQQTNQEIIKMNPKDLEDLTEQLQHINPQVKPIINRVSNLMPSMMNQKFYPPQERKMPQQTQQLEKVSLPKSTIKPQVNEISPQTQYFPSTSTSIYPLEKLMPFLKDPTVNYVECPGPNKNILISKKGVKQQTQIILTPEEVTNIMNEISEKTRIPVIQGLFRAALGNLIFSAIFSDFIGTSFNIQKITTPIPPRPIRIR